MEESLFFEVVRRQRAHRAFGPDPVPDDLLATVLEAATHAPSAENSQPWVFVLLRDADNRRAIEALARAAWDRGAGRRERARLPGWMFEEVDAAVRGGIAGAPVVVVVCGDTRLVHPSVLGASVFPATQNLLLAAAALGLGSALMTLPLGPPGEVAALLGLPAEVRPLAVVPLGWPDHPLGPPRRRPFSDTTYRERYGRTW